jgi:hypothetical protein
MLTTVYRRSVFDNIRHVKRERLLGFVVVDVFLWGKTSVTKAELRAVSWEFWRELLLSLLWLNRFYQQNINILFFKTTLNAI